jgi:hypothetical protein
VLPPEYPLSRGVLPPAGFLPAGLFAGGAGGVGFAFVAGAPFATPLAFAAAGAGGGGGLLAAAGGGGGACRTSSRYAAGVQPEAE